jgi:2'-5' RNA ligase
MANKATAKPNETTCPDCRKKIPDYYAQSGRPNPLGEKLSPARQADLDRESEEIKKNKESVSFPHKFKAAQWTHPNGHPRCKHCGQEERIGGTCVQEARNGASRFQSVAALKGYKFYRKVDGVFGGYKQYKSGDGGMLNVYDHDPKRLSWAIQHGKHGTKYGNDTKSLHSLFGKMYPVKPTKPRKKVKVKESLSEDHYRVGQQVKTPVSVGRVTQIRNYGTDDEQYEVETQGGRKEWVRPDELSLVNESEDYKYSSVQVNLPRPMALEMEVWSHRKINPADVVKWPDHPHVTVKYGIIDEDSSEVREALKGHHAIRLQLGEYGMFPDRGEGDVLLIHVESQDLNRMNQHIVDSVPTHSTYSEYKPHLTLAYVKAGLGKHYLEQLEPDRRWQGRTLVIPEVVFSSKNGSQTSIQLDVAEALIEQKLETVTSGAIGSGPYGVANTELRPIFPRTITCTACGSELTPYVSTGRCPKCNSIIKGGP